MILQPKRGRVEHAVDIIGGLARRHDDTIQKAMANDYLWQSAAGPVDVCSSDIASIFMNAYLVFGLDQLEGALDRVVRDLPSTGRGQIDMALDLARTAGEERSKES
jgi:hypothetical protein